MNGKMKITVCFVLIVSVLAGAFLANAASNVPTDAIVYGNNAYKFYNSSVSYSRAADQCGKMGGHLVYINTSDELDFLKQHSRDTMWCGAEMKSAGVWKWGDDSEVKSAFWAGNMAPASTDGAYGAINLASSNVLQKNSSASYGYICEWENGAAAFTTTTTTTAATTTATTTTATTTTTTTAATTTTTASKTTTSKTTATTAITASTASTAPQELTGASVPITRPTVIATLPTTAVAEPVSGETITVADDPLAGLDIGDTIFVYENDFYYKIANGSEIVIAYYVGNSADVTIPSYIDSMPVKYISQRAFQKQTLTSAVIPPTVTIIDDSAFCNVSSDFSVHGAKGSMAEIFAAKFGYIFVEEDFTEPETVSAEQTTAGSAQEPEKKLSKRSLAVIIGGIAMVVIVAAVAAFLFIRRKKDEEEMMEYMETMDENEGYVSDEAEESDADAEEPAEETEDTAQEATARESEKD